MDSKHVNQSIKKHIIPFLKKNGFEIFTSRTAWRHFDKKIDVINFQSFNSYHANVLNCTTYSFSVNLGIFFEDIPFPYDYKVKEKFGLKCPQEYECHFRRSLLKDLKQNELKNEYIWFVDSEGKYLDLAIQDVRDRLTSSALSWFSRFENEKEVIRTLIEDNENNKIAWGFGAKSSPNRSYKTGYIALALGDYKLASAGLKKAID